MTHFVAGICLVVVALVWVFIIGHHCGLGKPKHLKWLPRGHWRVHNLYTNLDGDFCFVLCKLARSGGYHVKEARTYWCDDDYYKKNGLVRFTVCDCFHFSGTGFVSEGKKESLT